MLELVDESVTGIVDEETTDTTESLGRKELDLSGRQGIRKRAGYHADLCSRVFRVDQTGRVNLHLLEIDTLGTDGHGHLVAVTSAVGAIGGRLEGISSIQTDTGRNSQDRSTRVGASSTGNPE